MSRRWRGHVCPWAAPKSMDGCESFPTSSGGEVDVAGSAEGTGRWRIGVIVSLDEKAELSAR